MPTRRSNRLRAAALAATANSATPDDTHVTPAPAAAEIPTAPTPTVVSTAASSRRARRLAAAGTPAAQPMTAPAEVITRPAAPAPVDSVSVIPEPAVPARLVFEDSAPTGPAPVAVDATPAGATQITIEPIADQHPAETTAPEADHVDPVVAEPVAFENADSVIATPVTVEPAPLAGESVVSAPPADAASSGSRAAASDVDVFAEAAEAFGFAAIDDGADAPAAVEVPVADEAVVEGAAPSHIAPQRPRRVLRRVVAAGASLGVMGVAGLIAVSMTLPVSAVAASQGADARTSASLVAGGDETKPKVSDDEIQAYVASSDVEGEALARSDAFSTVSLSEVAAEEGIKFSESLYTNDPDAAIQWPFIVGVAMSSPYGQRWGRLHAGIDLVPGNGAPIQAIADGVVRKATEAGGAYGVTVYIDHVIDGQVVTSHYAHMQHGSLQVQTGQQVKVGDIIGKVGNTGRSYGAHLHFEIIINGSTVDPLPWMRKNAGRYEY